IKTRSWPRAAELLNAFNRTDIGKILSGLSQDQIAALHGAATQNPHVGPDSQAAQLTRWRATAPKVTVSNAVTKAVAPIVAEAEEKQDPAAKAKVAASNVVLYSEQRKSDQATAGASMRRVAKAHEEFSKTLPKGASLKLGATLTPQQAANLKLSP